MSNQSQDWQEQTTLGEKLSWVQSDAEQVAQFGSAFVNTFTRSLLFLFLNFGIMFYLNWRMALAVLPLLPLFIVLRRNFKSKIRDRAERAQKEGTRASSEVAEHLRAITQLQLLNAQNRRLTETVAALSAMVSAQLWQKKTEASFSMLVSFVLGFAILGVLSAGTLQYLAGYMSIGSVVAFYAYASRMFEPISMAMELYSKTQRVLVSATRVDQILRTTPSVSDSGEICVVPSPLIVGLNCSDISFSYSGGFVLHRISFAVAPGERIGIGGKSGSGKSTLTRLLARMADASSGVIELEGKPISSYKLSTLRQTVCYVPQRPMVFSGTVRQNMQYANPGATEEEIHESLEKAQFQPVLDRMPSGLDTEIGPEACMLSGGEYQRLAIARALVQRPAILILDEATSALDLPTEEKIFRSIACRSSELILIIVSHRLSSLSWIDRIMILDSGFIKAEGAPSDLYRHCPAYRTLCEHSI
jgi:ABC-type multidrug transport system fused ATPase/permease subunit